MCVNQLILCCKLFIATENPRYSQDLVIFIVLNELQDEEAAK